MLLLLIFLPLLAFITIFVFGHRLGHLGASLVALCCMMGSVLGAVLSFFMLILVTSDNLIQLFLGWGGVGLFEFNWNFFFIGNFVTSDLFSKKVKLFVPKGTNFFKMNSSSIINYFFKDEKVIRMPEPCLESKIFVNKLNSTYISVGVHNIRKKLIFVRYSIFNSSMEKFSLFFILIIRNNKIGIWANSLINVPFLTDFFDFEYYWEKVKFRDTNCDAKFNKFKLKYIIEYYSKHKKFRVVSIDKSRLEHFFLYYLQLTGDIVLLYNNYFEQYNYYKGLYKIHFLYNISKPEDEEEREDDTIRSFELTAEQLFTYTKYWVSSNIIFESLPTQKFKIDDFKCIPMISVSGLKCFNDYFVYWENPKAYYDWIIINCSDKIDQTFKENFYNCMEHYSKFVCEIGFNPYCDLVLNHVIKRHYPEDYNKFCFERSFLSDMVIMYLKHQNMYESLTINNIKKFPYNTYFLSTKEDYFLKQKNNFNWQCSDYKVFSIEERSYYFLSVYFKPYFEDTNDKKKLLIKIDKIDYYNENGTLLEINELMNKEKEEYYFDIFNFIDDKFFKNNAYPKNLLEQSVDFFLNKCKKFNCNLASFSEKYLTAENSITYCEVVQHRDRIFSYIVQNLLYIDMLNNIVKNKKIIAHWVNNQSNKHFITIADTCTQKFWDLKKYEE